jgi:hypothetical protein
MTETTQPTTDLFTAADKARLITEALDTLRGANAIDERETLDATSWVAWYDATVPRVTDIEVLAGAMKVELSIRRGERIAAEGERRGGDQKSADIKVSTVDTLILAERIERSKDRRLAEHADAVRTYVQAEATACRVPTRTGAMRMVKARTIRGSAPATQRAPAVASQFRGAQIKAQRRAEQILAALEVVADGTHRSDSVLQRAIRSQGSLRIEDFFRTIRLIPWLAITRDDTGTTLTIDEELRAICDGRTPRPALGGRSITAFLNHLRAEIQRRRKENHDEYKKKKWVSDLIAKRTQTLLLDWIEEELNTLP